MKVLRTFSGREFVLEEDEADNIVKIKKGGIKAFIKLRFGDYIDTSAIETITAIPLIPFKNGIPLSKDGRSYIKDGIRFYIENFSSVEYFDDPKYEKIHEAVKKDFLENQRLKLEENNEKK